jgi:hypothetical protein
MTEPFIPSPRFRKSSSCAAGNCVEVAALPNGKIGIRGSRDGRPDSPCLTFTAAEWDAFIARVLAGELTRGALVSQR